MRAFTLIALFLAVAFLAYSISNILEHKAIRDNEQPGCAAEYLNYLGIIASTISMVLIFISIIIGE